jgi:hypothetical protein
VQSRIVDADAELLIGRVARAVLVDDRLRRCRRDAEDERRAREGDARVKR